MEKVQVKKLQKPHSVLIPNGAVQFRWLTYRLVNVLLKTFLQIGWNSLENRLLIYDIWSRCLSQDGNDSPVSASKLETDTSQRVELWTELSFLIVDCLADGRLLVLLLLI